MKSYRLERVAEVIRETAASAILFEIKDPRVKNVTVTRAEVSADLQHAKVFVSVMGTEKQQRLALHGLESAAGFIQTKVAKQLTSRFVPHIRFVLDDGVKKSVEIERLIRAENDRRAADRAAAGEKSGDGPTGEVDRTEPADDQHPDGAGEGSTIDPEEGPAGGNRADAPGSNQAANGAGNEASG